jgi:hydrogenase nickel incorporation protein HypA/HybF
VHELSICQALLTQVAGIAAGHGGGAVARITIEVGPLAGVDAAQLAGTFEVMRAGSCAAQAALVIESSGVVVECMSCHARSAAAPNRLLCGECGGYRTQVVAGDELRLRRVELNVATSDAPTEERRCARTAAAP